MITLLHEEAVAADPDTPLLVGECATCVDGRWWIGDEVCNAPTVARLDRSLGAVVRESGAVVVPLDLKRATTHLLRVALGACDGNATKAAALLGCHAATVRRLSTQAGLPRWRRVIIDGAPRYMRRPTREGET